MTNKEAIQAILGQVTIPDNSLQLALTDAGYDPDTTYDKSNSTAIGGIACDLLVGILSAPSVSEGGYSIKYDLNGVKSLLTYLAKKYGRDDILSSFSPTIEGVSPW